MLVGYAEGQTFLRALDKFYYMNTRTSCSDEFRAHSYLFPSVMEKEAPRRPGEGERLKTPWER